MLIHSIDKPFIFLLVIDLSEIGIYKDWGPIEYFKTCIDSISHKDQQ